MAAGIMFGSGMQKTERPLIIVCEDRDMVYANYLIQLISQTDDAGDSIVGVEDGSVSAAIYTTKIYKDNLPQIPSTQHILFIGQSSVAKEQGKTIPDVFNKLGMHYGWLGKRAVLFIDNTSSDWIKLKDKKAHYTEFLQFSKERGMRHIDALAEYAKMLDGGIVDRIMPVVVGASKMVVDRNKTAGEVKAQQYRTLIKVFYEDGLRSFMEG